MSDHLMTSDALMTVDELAEMFRVPKATVYQWHHRGKGPRAIKVGKYVRYRVRDVDSWLDAQRDPRSA